MDIKEFRVLGTGSEGSYVVGIRKVAARDRPEVPPKQLVALMSCPKLTALPRYFSLTMLPYIGQFVLGS
ncbi:hypothetical protein GWI33_010345 [Rhynchophorus ferrugineus]|uniref:Uncharacterized protein n=1 Tax=Rhynchophorus ferrugineus TaxID=354439 RepID=A0A834ILW2_RHYFE|nr:hypothetical protein GWI33_010345 [Rhynchophorus ferrugineus]